MLYPAGKQQLSSCVPAAGSSRHLAVLTSDQAWQLYSVDNLSMPEQRFQLQWQSSRQASSVRLCHVIELST